MLLDLRGLQCNWNIRGAPRFTLYFIPQEYTVSFVVPDFTDITTVQDVIGKIR